MYKIRSPTMGYTYTYVVFTTILRVVPIWYFYCYPKNFLGYETVSFYQYLLFFWVFLQLTIMLALMATHKNRYKAFVAKGSHSIYTYTNKLLSQHVLTDFDYVDHVSNQRREAETPREFWRDLNQMPGSPFRLLCHISRSLALPFVHTLTKQQLLFYHQVRSYS